MPSDETAGADWNKIVTDGVSKVCGCGDSDELAGRLEAIFDDMIPMFSIDDLPESVTTRW